MSRISFIKISILTLLSCVTLENIEALSSADLDKIGVLSARKDYNVSGKGITVSVEDTFKAANESLFKHGDIVADYVKRVSPSSIILHLGREKTPGNVKIINDSSGPNIEQLFTTGFYRYEFPQAKNGSVYTIAYGNDNQMPGTTPASRALAGKIKQLNSNSNGAVLFVGDMKLDNLQNLTPYSFSAGIFASNYVIAPTSTTATQVSGSLDSMEFQREIGTSIAAPTVSGCLALMAEAFPKATGKQLAVLILDTAEPLSSISDEMVEKIRRSTNLSPRNIRKLPPQAIFGRGIINVHKAIERGKAILKGGADLPSEIREVPVPNSMIEKARYDIFAHKIYIAFHDQYASPTVKARVITYILSTLPTNELIHFPLYEDDDGVNIRPHAKGALKWVFEGIKEHRAKNLSYQEKLSAIVVNYALTLPQKDKEVLLKDEWDHYGKKMSSELKKILLTNLAGGAEIYLEEVKEELGKFFEENAQYDSWGAVMSNENLSSELNKLSEKEFEQIISKVKDTDQITPDAWLNFIRAINDNSELNKKDDLVGVVMGKVDIMKFDPSHFNDVKKNVSPEMRAIIEKAAHTGN